MGESWIEQLAAVLRRESAENPQKATAAEIAKFERDNSVAIPADWQDYFLSLNGTPAGYCGAECVTIGFWHLSQFKRLCESDTPADLMSLPYRDNWFSFADFAIDCGRWAVCWAPEVQPNSPVLVDNFNDTVGLFADGIEEFVHLLGEGNISRLMSYNQGEDGDV